MYDLHTHTYLSDGVLCASELVQRYADAGYKGVVITDHVDVSTLDLIVPPIVKFCRETNKYFKNIDIIPGCELTHLPLGTFSQMVQKARSLGAQVVIIHGETIVEPVQKGTNREAILSNADILSHPGLITEEDVKLAAEHKVALEITSRHGHSFTNAHVARLGLKIGADLIYSSDFHEPKDLVIPEMVRYILQGASLSFDEVKQILTYTEEFFYNHINYE